MEISEELREYLGPLAESLTENAEKLTKNAEFIYALVDLLAAQNERLKKALYEIKEFGYNNSGKGYSCAKMAEAALKEEE